MNTFTVWASDLSVTSHGCHSSLVGFSPAAYPQNVGRLKSGVKLGAQLYYAFKFGGTYIHTSLCSTKIVEWIWGAGYRLL